MQGADLGDAELVVLLVEAERHQQDLAEGGRVERGDRARHHVLVPAVQVVVRAARREAGVHQPQRLHHAAAAQLVQHVAAHKVVGGLDGVRVDAAHEVRRRRLERVRERLQLRDEEAAHRAEASGVLLAAALALLGLGFRLLDALEHALDEWVAHALDDAL